MDYRVALDIYKGPLDLLLYLIQENEVDVYDIPVATITDQYMRHLEIIKILDPNIAGEFLVMASTLMEIKSRMLLPKPERVEEEEEEGDPRIELIRQLMEYKKFKEAAAALAERRREQLERFGRGSRQKFEGMDEEEEDLEVSEVSIWDILSAFDRVMRQTLRLKPATIVDRDVPVREHIESILRMLRLEAVITFLAIFRRCEDRIEAIGALLALLEMTRARVISLEQAAKGAEITIRLVDESNVARLLREVTERHIPPEEAAEEEPPPEEAPQTPAAPDETPAEAVPAAGADEAGGEDEGEETDEEIEQIRSIEIHDVMLAEEDAPSESTAPPDEDRDDPADEETT